VYTEYIHKMPSTGFKTKIRFMHHKLWYIATIPFIRAVTRDIYGMLAQCSISVVRGLGLDVRCTE